MEFIYWPIGGGLWLFQVIIMFFVIYQVAISVPGMIMIYLSKGKRNYNMTPVHRFAVLVCAHNEQAVVGQIVQSLFKMTYPRELYDVYVICDNCSDNTADKVREAGAIAMERHDLTKRGKGFGLEWMFDKLWDMADDGNVYDGIVVLDADNIVNSSFLLVMDKKMSEGYEVAQAYLDSKNPKDNWITKSYAFAYWSTNYIFQLARSFLGLSAQLGGTGMMLKASVLREMGWGATSLTEDLEFTARYVIKTGKPVGWAHDAIIYDEKPTGFKASFVQRVRWMQGHISCMNRYSWELMVAGFKQRSLKHFDVAIYLIQPTKILISGMAMLFAVMSWLQLVPEQLAPFILKPLWWIGVLWVYYGITVLGVIFEGKWKYSLWMAWAYMFSLTWVPVMWVAVFKKDKTTWTHTKHERTISDEELTALTASQ